jgi:4-hydroxybenzoate polyprenyltransferase
MLSIPTPTGVPSADKLRNLSVFASIARLHITLIAGLGTFTFGWLFTGEYPWLLAGICALDWFIVNLINRTVDLEEDRASAIPHTEYVAQRRNRLSAAIIAFLLVSFPAVYLLKPSITGLRVACHLLGACYNWPLLPRKRRLKQFYFLKNTASGVGFLLTVFGYPLVDAFEKGVFAFPPGIGWTTVCLSALFFFLFIQSYELIYDLRDLPGDTAAGVPTYPVVHGRRAAVRIVYGLIFSSIAVLIAGYAISAIPWRIFIMICAPIIQWLMFKRALIRGISAGDCIRMTWTGAALLFTYHLWVAARLPGAGLP